MLYGRTSPQLFAILLRMLRRRESAEEVLHEVFLKVWQTASGFDPGQGSAMAWLIGIARHSAIDRLRRQRHEIPLQDSPEIQNAAAPDPDPMVAALNAAEARRLAACLDELEPEPRDCVRLAYWEGLTHEQLAHRLGRPVGTVKSWVRRSLVRLRHCLDG